MDEFHVSDALDTLEKAQMNQADDDTPEEKLKMVNMAIDMAIESLKEALR